MRTRPIKRRRASPVKLKLKFKQSPQSQSDKALVKTEALTHKDLALELWYHILCKLHIRDMQSLHKTSHWFRELLDNDEIWRMLLHDRFKMRAALSCRDRYLLSYNRINWTGTPLHELDEIISEINERYIAFDCQPPPADIIGPLIVNEEINDNDELAFGITDDVPLIHALGLNGANIEFLVRNHPHSIEDILFTAHPSLRGNDPWYCMLLRDGQSVVQSVLDVLSERACHELTISNKYTILTTDGNDRFTTSGFRRLVWEAKYKVIDMLLERFGPEPFKSLLFRIDEVGFSILSEMTAASADRGAKDVKTLLVLYKYFGSELHQLVRLHIREKEDSNPFLSLASTTNKDFVHVFLKLFREEGQLFVHHFAPHIREMEFDFQQVFAFAKAWCFD